jgi:hypothetical protein
VEGKGGEGKRGEGGQGGEAKDETPLTAEEEEAKRVLVGQGRAITAAVVEANAPGKVMVNGTRTSRRRSSEGSKTSLESGGHEEPGKAGDGENSTQLVVESARSEGGAASARSEGGAASARSSRSGRSTDRRSAGGSGVSGSEDDEATQRTGAGAHTECTYAVCASPECTYAVCASPECTYAVCASPACMHAVFTPQYLHSSIRMNLELCMPLCCVTSLYISSLQRS